MLWQVLRTLAYWSLDADEPEDLSAAHPDLELIEVELRDPRFYHLDTCFCPITPRLAIWFPRAFTAASQERIRRAGLELVEVPENEAVRFACNSIALGKYALSPTSSYTSTLHIPYSYIVLVHVRIHSTTELFFDRCLCAKQQDYSDHTAAIRVLHVELVLPSIASCLFGSRFVPYKRRPLSPSASAALAFTALHSASLLCSARAPRSRSRSHTHQ